METKSMISVRSLCKSYGKLEVLRSLDLEIQTGKITGLAGPNACGKTTLIKSILGLVFPDTGEIYVNGKSVNDFSVRDLVGYMPQSPDFPVNLTTIEIFKLLQSVRKRPADCREELVELFNLGPFLKKPLGDLSTGTRQKVSAVCALMFEAPILILDEPTAGFDPVSAISFKELLLKRAGTGATILLVSHIIPELERLIDNLVFLLDGKLLFEGSIDRLLSETATADLESGIVQLLGHSRPAENSTNGAAAQ